jgi:hypothetical protein
MGASSYRSSPNKSRLRPDPILAVLAEKGKGKNLPMPVTSPRSEAAQFSRRYENTQRTVLKRRGAALART